MMQRLVVGLTLVLAACGGGASSGPVSMEAAQAGCQAECQHRIDCGSERPLAECTAECVAEVVGVIRDDVFTDVTDCTSALACGASSNQCEALCSPTSAHDRYEAACRAVFTACPDTIDLGVCSVRPTGTNGDDGFFCFFTPAIVDEFTACLPSGATCDAALGCMSGVAESHNIDL